MAPLPDYLCIVSKIHVIEPFDLRGRERTAFWDDVLRVAEAIGRVRRPTKLNYEIHGNTLPHLHLHLYPRFRSDPFEGGPIDPKGGPGFTRTDEDLRQLREAIDGAS